MSLYNVIVYCIRVPLLCTSRPSKRQSRSALQGSGPLRVAIVYMYVCMCITHIYIYIYIYI